MEILGSYEWGYGDNGFGMGCGNGATENTKIEWGNENGDMWIMRMGILGTWVGMGYGNGKMGKMEMECGYEYRGIWGL